MNNKIKEEKAIEIVKDDKGNWILFSEYKARLDAEFKEKLKDIQKINNEVS